MTKFEAQFTPAARATHRSRTSFGKISAIMVQVMGPRLNAKHATKIAVNMSTRMDIIEMELSSDATFVLEPAFGVPGVVVMASDGVTDGSAFEAAASWEAAAGVCTVWGAVEIAVTSAWGGVMNAKLTAMTASETVIPAVPQIRSGRRPARSTYRSAIKVASRLISPSPTVAASAAESLLNPACWK